MTKKHDNSTFENDADKKALAGIDLASADPFGDLDDDEPAAVEAAADGPEDEIEDTPGDSVDDKVEEAPAIEAAETPPKEQATPAATVEEAAPTPATPALDYKTPPRAELDAQRKALRDEKAKAFTDFDEGTIDSAAYLAIEARVDDSLDDLATQRALLQANEQKAMTAQETKLEAIKAAAKAAGTIDYTDAAAAEEFNAALQFVASIKGNAGLNFDALADKAHTMVLAQRGIAPAKPATPAVPLVPRVAPKAPITLSGIPAAATPNGNGGINETLGRLHGLDFQEAVGRMPKAQRDAWLDS